MLRVKCNMQDTLRRSLVQLLKQNFINYIHNTKRYYCSRKTLILGIETSFDDTGCAVVDGEGNILGEALNSQHSIHLKHGGLIPPIAQYLHRKNIEEVVSEAVAQAKVSFNDLDAVATTVKPGLPLSLSIGMKYGKYLCRTHGKPFIPVHHMEAHALTARMHDPTIEFPFLVLLISGGHCLLAIARNVDDFLLMGQSLDDAPGEAFDKMARRLKLKHIPEFSELSGGQAIELAASRADNPLEFKFTATLLNYRDCNFSMAGIKNQFLRHVTVQEKEHDLPPDGVVPSLYNLCAGFQLIIARHLCHRVQRGIEYAALKELIPEDKQTLVVSGGVACNNFITAALKTVCDELDYRLVRPPPKLCTDNGVMIAWNGIERWKANIGITNDLDSITVEKSHPLGRSIICEVAAANIRPKWIKLNKFVSNYIKQNDLLELKVRQ